METATPEYGAPMLDPSISTGVASRMTSKVVSVRLDLEQLAALDAVAARRRKYRSDLLSEAVEQWLQVTARELDLAQLIAAADVHTPDDLTQVGRALRVGMDKIEEARQLLLALGLAESTNV